MNKHSDNVDGPPPHWFNILAQTKLAYRTHFRFQSHYGHEQIYFLLGTGAILITAAAIWWFFGAYNQPAVRF